MLNDFLRAVLRYALVALGHTLGVLHTRRFRNDRRIRAELIRRYDIRPDTPIRPWGPEVEADVVRFAEQQNAGYATTSGTTARPKRIAYPKSRIKAVKWIYSDGFARMFSALGVQRTSLYVFSALAEDGSLTGMMLEERRLVPYLSGLQAPYRVHAHRAMTALAKTYGAAAARFFVLCIANPGVLYATNPSTLAWFFDEVNGDWDRVRRLACDFLENPERFDPVVRRIRRRLDSVGADTRLALALKPTPPAVDVFLPNLEAYCCWDGGYVRPFLDRVQHHLSAGRYRHVPMYSMSTETVETIPSFDDGRVHFVPIAPDVLAELLPEDADDDPIHLIPPDQAQIGSSYTLVVSDPYGLVRYQTADVFRCVAFVKGLPDLRFERRRGLAHSFTGEKITGAQLEAAYRTLDTDAFLTCIPAASPEPHYELVVVGETAPDGIAQRFDEALGAINSEYASKRKSGRLAPPIATASNIAALVERIGGGADWESQMKLLPLSLPSLQKRPPNTSDAPPSLGSTPAVSGGSSTMSQRRVR